MGRITETHVAIACYYGNGERWRRNKCRLPMTLMHGRSKAKLT